METVEYAAGRHADVFGETSQPTVLLWHGQQPDARSSVRRLAELIAGHGVGVIAPDWNSYADDGGRADLLRSVQFARERVHDPDDLVLVGWSMGGLAAAGLTVHAQRLDMAFAHTVCLAGAFMVPDPIFNELPASQVSADAPRSPFTLLHGMADRVVPASVAYDSRPRCGRTTGRCRSSNYWLTTARSPARSTTRPPDATPLPPMPSR